MTQQRSLERNKVKEFPETCTRCSSFHDSINAALLNRGTAGYHLQFWSISRVSTSIPCRDRRQALAKLRIGWNPPFWPNCAHGMHPRNKAADPGNNSFKTYSFRLLPRRRCSGSRHWWRSCCVSWNPRRSTNCRPASVPRRQGARPAGLRGGRGARARMAVCADGRGQREGRPGEAGNPTVSKGQTYNEGWRSSGRYH